MTMSAQAKAKVVAQYRRDTKDTGSPEVQIALMTARIEDLSGHFKTHVQDTHSRQGLLRLVNRRRKLLDYLRATSADRYKSLIEQLGLRK